MSESSVSAARLPVGLLLLCLLPFSAQAQLSGRDGPNLSGRPLPLPLDQAFPYFVSVESTGQLSVTWEPAPDHYLYRHQFGFTLLHGNGGERQALTFRLADGEKKTDEFFGDIEAYYGQVTVWLDLTAAEGSADRLEIRFQGCADWGFCYPPQVVEYSLKP